MTNNIDSVQTNGNDDLFQTFQNSVHLNEDLNNDHVFVVMGASVIQMNIYIFILNLKLFCKTTTKCVLVFYL